MRVHIVKREDCPLLKKILLIVGAVALALVLGGLVHLLQRHVVPRGLRNVGGESK